MKSQYDNKSKNNDKKGQQIIIGLIQKIVYFLKKDRLEFVKQIIQEYQNKFQSKLAQAFRDLLELIEIKNIQIKEQINVYQKFLSQLLSKTQQNASRIIVEQKNKSQLNQDGSLLTIKQKLQQNIYFLIEDNKSLKSQLKKHQQQCNSFLDKCIDNLSISSQISITISVELRQKQISGSIQLSKDKREQMIIRQLQQKQRLNKQIQDLKQNKRQLEQIIIIYKEDIHNYKLKQEVNIQLMNNLSKQLQNKVKEDDRMKDFLCLYKNALIDVDINDRYVLLNGVIDQIKSACGRKVKAIETLYNYKLQSQINFHKLIDNHKNILLLCITEQNKLFGAFTTQSFSINPLYQGQKIHSFLIHQSKDNLNFYNFIGRRSIEYDYNYLIFGNEQISIQRQKLQFQTTIGRHYIKYEFDYHNSSQTILSDLCEKENTSSIIKLINYEIIEVIF